MHNLSKQAGRSRSESGAGNDFQLDRGMRRTHVRKGRIQYFTREGHATAALGAATGPRAEVTQRTSPFAYGLPDGRIRHGIANAYIHERKTTLYYDSLLWRNHKSKCE